MKEGKYSFALKQKLKAEVEFVMMMIFSQFLTVQSQRLLAFNAIQPQGRGAHGRTMIVYHSIWFSGETEFLVVLFSPLSPFIHLYNVSTC